MQTQQRNLILLGLVLLCTLLGACEAESRAPLIASNIEVLNPLPGMNMSAAYLTLTNNSSTAIEITDVISDQYNAVEIHESQLENGIAKMRRLRVLRIAANSSTTLERGGKHLMMIGPVDHGESVSLTFFSGDTVLLRVDTPRIRGRE